jgi:hypothetical protein
MKKWIINLLLTSVLFILANKANGQILTQTYLDPCDNKVYVVTFPLPNNVITAIVRNKAKTFTYLEAQSGVIQTWVNSIFATPCPTQQVVLQQTITNTVTQAASQAATQAASSAASAASGAASSAASSASTSASSTASTSASSASTSGASSSSSSSSSSSQSSSSSTESSSSTSSSESKSESTSSSSESKSESKSESSESKSESKEESKSESKEEKKEEKKSEKKEEKKKDEKKQAKLNPIMFGSDLTIGQNAAGGFTPIISIGMNQGSATGESSWGVTSMIWGDLKSIAISANKSDLVFKDGQLKAINAYSYTIARVNGTNMTFGGYTWIKPHPKYGTIGFNASYINVKLKGTNDYSYSFMSSLTGFWTKPYQISPRSTLSPGIFVMASPYSYNSQTGNTFSYNIGGLIGTGYSYRISKRFGLNIDYKINASTTPGSPILSFFLIGSKLML